MLRRAEPTSNVETPPLQFHPSTKLLIAVGKPAELAIVEQLVLALGGPTMSFSTSFLVALSL